MLKPAKQLKFFIDIQYEQQKYQNIDILNLCLKYHVFRTHFIVIQSIMNNIQILFIHRLQQSYKF